VTKKKVSKIKKKLIVLVGSVGDTVYVAVKAEPSTRTTRAARKAAAEDSSEGWEIVGGAARCQLCIKDNAQCRINMAAIDKWKETFESGKAGRRNPPRTSCKRCLVKKKKCELPATKDIRDALARATPGAAPSVASSGTKRRREVEVVVPALPQAKRARRTSPEVSDGEFRRELLKVLRKIEGHLDSLAKAANEPTKRGGKGKEKATDEVDHEMLDGAEEIEIEDRSSEIAEEGGQMETSMGSEEEGSEEDESEIVQVVVG
jgi:hypothetical protein